jgi:hypothetical protein
MAMATCICSMMMVFSAQLALLPLYLPPLLGKEVGIDSMESIPGLLKSLTFGLCTLANCSSILLSGCDSQGYIPESLKRGGPSDC